MPRAERPREIAPGIWWLGGCTETSTFASETIHVHSSLYLILGGERTLLVDTGNPRDWDLVRRDLTALLGGRRLDWIAPTHPELAHCGNLNRLLDHFPEASVIGDVRDYHLYYPQHAGRLVPFERNRELTLGGGYEAVLLPALIRDLPSSQWVYEKSQRVLCVADGFSYTHHPPVDGQPVHKPGECALSADELPGGPSIEQATYLTRASLYWTRFVDMTSAFHELDSMLERYPAKVIAPSHGSVIRDLGAVLPIIREAHRLARVS